MENSNQKIRKISMSSLSENSCEEINDSIEFERTPAVSMNIYEDELLSLVQILSQTLSQQSLFPILKGEPLDKLKTLTSVICCEYSKLAHSSALIPEPLPIPEIPSVQPTNLIDKLVFPQTDSTILTKTECKEISSLIVGLFRESSNLKINSKIIELETTIIECSKTITHLNKKKMKYLKLNQKD